MWNMKRVKSQLFKILHKTIFCPILSKFLSKFELNLRKSDYNSNILFHFFIDGQKNGNIWSDCRSNFNLLFIHVRLTTIHLKALSSWSRMREIFIIFFSRIDHFWRTLCDLGHSVYTFCRFGKTLDKQDGNLWIKSFL